MERVNLEKLIINSNRGPTVFRKEEDVEDIHIYPGGLSTALASPAAQADDAVWICSTTTEFERRYFKDGRKVWVDVGMGGFYLTEALIRPDVYRDFYDGVSVEWWWLTHESQPFHAMSHTAFPKSRVPREKMEGYRKANASHAERALAVACEGKGTSLLFPQDLHLQTFSTEVQGRLTEELQERLLLMQFLHTPIPPAETLENALEDGSLVEDIAREMVTGTRHNHLVLTQTDRDAANLAKNFELFGYQAAKEGDLFTIRKDDERFTRIGANPIGIDTQAAVEEAGQRINVLSNYRVLSSNHGDRDLRGLIESYREEGYLIGGSVERLDPTKGLLLRLQAIEKAMETAYRKGDEFIYIGFWPGDGRGTNLDYLAEQSVHRINKKAYELFGHDVIFYHFGGIDAKDARVFQRELDFFTVTPLDDGRNLTAEEYGMAQSVKNRESRGFLMLGECGTKDVYQKEGLTREDGIVYVNVLDVEETADQLVRALHDRPRASDKWTDTITKYDVNRGWMSRNLTLLGEVAGKELVLTPAESHHNI